MIWKTTSILFAMTTSILLVRVLTPPALPVPGPAVARRTDGERVPATMAASMSDDAHRPDSDSNADAVGLDAGTGRSVDPALARLTPSELVALVVPLRESLQGRDSLPARTFRALAARREEVRPVIEAWLDRAEEIRKAGGHIDWLPGVYARLFGRDSVARLEALARGTAHVRPLVDALQTIRDPAAVAALRRLQESARPNSSLFRPDAIVGTAGGLDLLREWSHEPPRNQEHLRLVSRETLLRHGTDGDRDDVWRVSTPDERVRLIRLFRPGTMRGDPWPARLREAAIAGLESGDQWVCLTAVRSILKDPQIFGAGAVEAAEAAIATALAREPSSDEERQMRRVYEELEGSLAARRSRAEAEKIWAAFLSGL